MSDKKMYKEGHFIGLSMALGSAFGVALFTPFAISLDMLAFIGLGPAIGVSVGLAIGSVLEAQYKQKGQIETYSDEEKAKQRRQLKKFMFVGIGILFAIVALALLFVSFS